MSLSTDLAELFGRDLTRVQREIAAFPDSSVLWKTIPGTTNSGGNLALHLEGNLREYIGRQLGDIAYARQRPAEFSSTGLAVQEVIARVEGVRAFIVPVLEGLSDEDLDAEYPEKVFGAPISTRLFLVHLLGHLNYHLGQIDYLRRILTEGRALPLAGLPERK